MTLTVNGEKKNIISTNIAELFAELDIERQGLAVHVNGRLVLWTQYKNFRLHEHDEIGILRVAGGG